MMLKMLVIPKGNRPLRASQLRCGTPRRPKTHQNAPENKKPVFRGPFAREARRRQPAEAFFYLPAPAKPSCA